MVEGGLTWPAGRRPHEGYHEQAETSGGAPGKRALRTRRRIGNWQPGPDNAGRETTVFFLILGDLAGSGSIGLDIFRRQIPRQSAIRLKPSVSQIVRDRTAKTHPAPTLRV